MHTILFSSSAAGRIALAGEGVKGVDFIFIFRSTFLVVCCAQWHVCVYVLCAVRRTVVSRGLSWPAATLYILRVCVCGCVCAYVCTITLRRP